MHDFAGGFFTLMAASCTQLAHLIRLAKYCPGRRSLHFLLSFHLISIAMLLATAQLAAALCQSHVTLTQFCCARTMPK